jgi:Putative serine esterase (DUF676)
MKKKLSMTKILKKSIPLALGVAMTVVAAFWIQQQQQPQLPRLSSLLPNDSKLPSGHGNQYRQLFSTSSWMRMMTTTTSSSTSSNSNDRDPLSASTTDDVMVMSNHIHLIVTVHGWLGSPDELGYLQETLQRQDQERKIKEIARQKNQQQQQQQQQQQTTTIVHAAQCNHGRTSDGIVAGGTRLSNEINSLIEKLVLSSHGSEDNVHVTVSLVGNSLGGLYARYALRDIQWGGRQLQLQPKPRQNSIRYTWSTYYDMYTSSGCF